MIRELTPELLKQQAREAAEQRIPLRECNHYEPGTKPWAQFAEAWERALLIELRAIRPTVTKEAPCQN